MGIFLARPISSAKECVTSFQRITLNGILGRVVGQNITLKVCCRDHYRHHKVIRKSQLMALDKESDGWLVYCVYGISTLWIIQRQIMFTHTHTHTHIYYVICKRVGNIFKRSKAHMFAYGFKYCYITRIVWPIVETLTGTNTPSQSEPGSYDDEEVLYIYLKRLLFLY